MVLCYIGLNKDNFQCLSFTCCYTICSTLSFPFMLVALKFTPGNLIALFLCIIYNKWSLQGRSFLLLLLFATLNMLLKQYYWRTPNTLGERIKWGKGSKQDEKKLSPLLKRWCLHGRESRVTRHPAMLVKERPVTWSFLLTNESYTFLFVSPFCACRQHYENGQTLFEWVIVYIIDV